MKHRATDFAAYVSRGSKAKLECYCQTKSPGCVIIFQYTSGPENGTIVMCQITSKQTLADARCIVLSQTNKKRVLDQIHALNYKH